MKYVVLAAALAASLLASDVALARGRRGGCPGGNCSVQKVSAVQAPVQKQVAKGEASPSDQAKQAAEAAPAAPQVVTTATATQRTRRFAAFNRIGRRN